MQQTLKSVALSLLLLAAHTALGQVQTSSTNWPARPGPSALAPTSIGEWCAPSKGIRARLAICAAPNESGRQIAVAYLEVQRADVVSPMMMFYSPFGMQCELRDAGGAVVSPLPRMRDGPLPPSYWLALPDDSCLRFRANPVLGYVGDTTQNDFRIFAGMDSWGLPPGDTNDYYLTATLTLAAPSGQPVPAFTDARWGTPIVWEGKLKLPPVKIKARK